MAIATSPLPQSRNPALIGIAWKVASAVVFTVMLALVKYVGDRVPVGQILFSRNFFGLIPVFIMVMMQGSVRRCLVTANPFGHVKRAATGVLAMGLWFAALQRLSLPEATAIVYAAPLFMVIFAALLLGETVRIYRWSAVAVGFLGVLVIVSPQFAGGANVTDAALTGVVLALTAAFFMALTTVFVRQLTATEETSTIVIYFFLTASLISLASLPFGWVLPSTEDLLVLVLIGVLGGVGQIMVTNAFQHAEASVIAPFEYTSMIWAVSLGYLFFGEVPRTMVLVGALIVIASGVFVIFRERQLGLEREERKLGAPLRP